jgi:hypothetical protein
MQGSSGMGAHAERLGHVRVPSGSSGIGTYAMRADSAPTRHLAVIVRHELERRSSIMRGERPRQLPHPRSTDQPAYAQSRRPAESAWIDDAVGIDARGRLDPGARPDATRDPRTTPLWPAPGRPANLQPAVRPLGCLHLRAGLVDSVPMPQRRRERHGATNLYCREAMEGVKCGHPSPSPRWSNAVEQLRSAADDASQRLVRQDERRGPAQVAPTPHNGGHELTTCVPGR